MAGYTRRLGAIPVGGRFTRANGQDLFVVSSHNGKTTTASFELVADSLVRHIQTGHRAQPEPSHDFNPLSLGGYKRKYDNFNKIPGVSIEFGDDYDHGPTRVVQSSIGNKRGRHLFEESLIANAIYNQRILAGFEKRREEGERAGMVKEDVDTPQEAPARESLSAALNLARGNPSITDQQVNERITRELNETNKPQGPSVAERARMLKERDEELERAAVERDTAGEIADSQHPTQEVRARTIVKGDVIVYPTAKKPRTVITKHGDKGNITIRTTGRWTEVSRLDDGLWVSKDKVPSDNFVTIFKRDEKFVNIKKSKK